MIKSVTVTNHLGGSIKLELAFPEKSGFVVQSIEGLGPPKASINTTELVTSDGTSFNSAKANSRNIVIALKFIGSPTIEDSRQKSYRFFPIKKLIKLTIETDNRISEIFGFVESNEPTIFSKESGCQISLICPDPYFRSIDFNRTVFSGVDPIFEFPFENDSLDVNLLELGSIRTDLLQNVYYSGEVPVGLVISIHAIGDASDISIYNVDTREMMFLKIDLINRDDLIISTVQGSKSISLVRDGVTTNVLNSLYKNSDWFKLHKGDNLFAYEAEIGETNLLFDIRNFVLFEGV